MKSLKKTKHVKVDDIIDDEGLWVSTYSINTPDYYLNHTTKSFGIWLNISSRCGNVRDWDKRNIGYRETKNLFVNYQEFAEWAISQYGYKFKDSKNNSWEIDKDIFGGVGADYSKENCIFVPPEINKLFTQRSNDRGLDPMGVSWRERFGKYASQCSIDSVQKHLGWFDSQEAAHKAWQEAKFKVILVKMNEFKEHERLCEGLSRILTRLKFDIENNLETKNLLVKG